MDQQAPREIYLKRKENFETLLKRQKKILLYISLLRLVVISFSIYFLVAALNTGIPILWVIMSMLVILFFALVSYHKNQNDRRKLLNELVLLNERELKCLDNDFKGNQHGEQFLEPDHPWSFDLDLFGEGSFFQYINRTSTHAGPFYLAERLRTPNPDELEIRKRQDLIRELASKMDLRQIYIAHAGLMDKNEEEYESMINWAEQPVFIEEYKWTKAIAWIISALSSTILVAGIFNPLLFQLLIPVVFINFMLLSPFLNRTNRYQVQVSRKHRFLKTYAVLLELLTKEEFSNADLIRIKEQCQNASKSIKKLSSLLDLFDQRLNILVGFVLNALFLFDFFMLHRLAAWKRQNKTELGIWLSIAGETDAFISLAGFAYNHAAFVYPTIASDFKGIKAIELGHPMIPAARRVNNSIEIINEKVVLITGANMAGKSTFLRSLGINMALSYAGCPVCAKEFVTGPYILYSSMRTTDSLKDEESYFFAEIKRLKKIVDLMKGGTKMLILLDEVLKGTNTTDKQKGSRGLIEKSIGHDVLCFIATHDLSLGKMEEEKKGLVINYCFESYIHDLQLSFDYKIRPGLAKNMNASFLMKQMGIMD